MEYFMVFFMFGCIWFSMKMVDADITKRMKTDYKLKSFMLSPKFKHILSRNVMFMGIVVFNILLYPIDIIIEIIDEIKGKKVMK